MMTDQTHSADAWLLKLFDQLKIHARAEAGAPTGGARERSHDSVRLIEIAIRDTPAESLIGVAIKLAVGGKSTALKALPRTQVLIGALDLIDASPGDIADISQ